MNLANLVTPTRYDKQDYDIEELSTLTLGRAISLNYAQLGARVEAYGQARDALTHLKLCQQHTDIQPFHNLPPEIVRLIAKTLQNVLYCEKIVLWRQAQQCCRGECLLSVHEADVEQGELPSLPPPGLSTRSVDCKGEDHVYGVKGEDGRCVSCERHRGMVGKVCDAVSRPAVDERDNEFALDYGTCRAVCWVLFPFPDPPISLFHLLLLLSLRPRGLHVHR